MSSQSPQALREEHTSFVDFHEDYVRHCIAMADTKATLLLGLVGALLTYLLGKATFHNLVLNPSWTWLSILAVTACLLLVGSGAGSIMVIAPRLSHSREGLVFFGAVAQYPSAGTYLDELGRRTGAELTAARIQHSYDVSRICARKYMLLRIVIWLGAGGIAACLPILGDL